MFHIEFVLFCNRSSEHLPCRHSIIQSLRSIVLPSGYIMLVVLPEAVPMEDNIRLASAAFRITSALFPVPNPALGTVLQKHFCSAIILSLMWAIDWTSTFRRVWRWLLVSTGIFMMFSWSRKTSRTSEDRFTALTKMSPVSGAASNATHEILTLTVPSEE